MSVVHTAPEGTCEFSVAYDDQLVMVREVRVRFTDLHGNRYLDFEGVCQLLDRIGWPPSPNPPLATIGTPMTNLLPPPALSILTLFRIPLWRVSDIIQAVTP